MKRVSRKQDSTGFTFFELVLVFMILGILAVALVPSFEDMDDVGYQAVQEATLGSLRTAWAVAYADNGNSPPTHTQVAELVLSADTDGSTETCKCGDGVTLISCDEVLTTTGTAGTEAEFGISGAACASTIADPMLIIILAS